MSQQKETLTVYQANERDLYVGPTEADPDRTMPGEFLIPRLALRAKPPELKEFEAAKINAARDGWDVIPYYVGYVYWTADGVRHVITEEGVVPPEDHLKQPPDAPAVEPVDALTQAKQDAIKNLNDACAAAIVAGFTSNATGKVYSYPSSQTDQLNLYGSATLATINQAVKGWTTDLSVCDKAGKWSYVPHTPKEVFAVVSDFSAHKAEMIDKKNQLVAEVMAAKDDEKIAEVKWI